MFLSTNVILKLKKNIFKNNISHLKYNIIQIIKLIFKCEINFLRNVFVVNLFSGYKNNFMILLNKINYIYIYNIINVNVLLKAQYESINQRRFGEH